MSGGGGLEMLGRQAGSYFADEYAAWLTKAAQVAGAAALDAGGVELAAVAVGYGSGLEWPSAEARGWVLSELPGGLLGPVSIAEDEVLEFWGESRAVGGPVRGRALGRTGRVQELIKVRLGASQYSWVPSGLKRDRELPAAVHGVRQVIPERVLEAEKIVGGAIEQARAVQKVWDSAGHAGAVTCGDVDGGVPWECLACGSVSMDKGLFQEMGEFCR